MTLRNFDGLGSWIPPMPNGITAGVLISLDPVLDADEEELQIIARVVIPGGGSKTFGGGSSAIDWLPGTPITFVASSTLRVGAKKASSIDMANGPAARATIGAAAFDVYKDLVGGTDTITATTPRSDAMPSGTPFAVANGDLIAICFHLDIVSAAQAIRIRHVGIGSASGFPATTLVTSGPTYTAQAILPNIGLIFSDGTKGWLTAALPFSVIDATSGTIGNTNIKGNIFRVPGPVKINLVTAVFNLGGNCAMDLYSDPLGTPILIESIAIDANVTGGTSNRVHTHNFVNDWILLPNTDYCIGLRQTSATAQTIVQRDVNDVDHWKAWGLGPTCYGATSTAGAAFVSDISSKRRYAISVNVSAINDNAGNAQYHIGI